MFVIVTYDINAKRVSKVMKICKKYLRHVQKSVFEGMITDAKLEKFKREVDRVIQYKEDSVCIYEINSLKYTCKEQLGLVMKSANIL